MRENWAVVALFTLCIVGFELRFIHGATDASDSEFLLLLIIFFTLFRFWLILSWVGCSKSLSFSYILQLILFIHSFNLYLSQKYVLCVMAFLQISNMFSLFGLKL